MADVTAAHVRRIRNELIPSQVEDDELLARRWAQLVRVATELFRRKGFHDTSIADIAQTSGIPVGSMYRYINKKEDILLLVLDRIMALYDEGLAPALATGEPVTALVRAMDAYYRVIDRNLDKVMLAYRETRSLDKAGRNYMKQRELETNALFERIVRDGTEQGLFRNLDPAMVAYNIITLGHMWAAKIWYFGKRLPLRDFVREESRFILRAILMPDQLDLAEAVDPLIQD